MMSLLKEILTYEIFQKSGKVIISLPVHGLMQPRFLVKHNDLYIFLYNYKKAYLIRDLPRFVLQAISHNRCFLIENLTFDEHTEHLVSLIPQHIEI